MALYYSPGSIYQNSNMTERLKGHTYEGDLFTCEDIMFSSETLKLGIVLNE